MMDAVKAGGDRQELHEKNPRIVYGGRPQRQGKGLDNNLLELIAADPGIWFKS